VLTQKELDMCKDKAALGSPAHSATSTVPSIAPPTTISPEENTKVNKSPQLLQILGADLDPSESGTNKLIQTDCQRLLIYYIPKLARN
jgi:hypothetical protein